jgi:nucleoside 2-deoxyribosyltransferase
MKVYLAAPFFRPDQVSTVDGVEKLLDDTFGQDAVYSPRRIGILTKNALPEERARIFRGNIDGIEGSTLMVAVIDDFDPGTVWEMGAAWAKRIPTIAYSNVPGRGLNVMLSQTCVGFANGVLDLQIKLDLWRRGELFGEVWAGEVQ